MKTAYVYIIPSVWDRAHTLEGDGALARVELLAELDELRSSLLSVEIERGALDAEFERIALDVGVSAGLRACSDALLEDAAHAEIDAAALQEAQRYMFPQTPQESDNV